jgi:hypothetical protein
MIIDSPVGRFPFEVVGVRLDDGHIRIEGAMGAWPTSVEVAPRDLPRIVARLVPQWPLVVLASVAVAALGSLARR